MDYNDKLRLAKEALDSGSYDKDTIEYIFPELAESEDEKIKKWLIGYFNQYIIDGMPPVFGNGLNVKDVIFWLEKQKSVEEIVARYKDSWYNDGKIQGMKEGLTDDEKYQQGWHDALEKQGEQNSAWNEEDDYNLQCMIAKVTSDIQKGNIGRNNELIDWLKSLKDRVQPQKQWKPSEEQLEFLKKCIESYNEVSFPTEFRVFRSLYNDLKKLTE